MQLQQCCYMCILISSKYIILLIKINCRVNRRGIYIPEVIDTFLLLHGINVSYCFVCLAEKPNISNLEPKFKSYGCPPVVVNVSWNAVPSNGDFLSYTVSYLACGHWKNGNFHELKKIASWCTRNSSTSFKAFSCDLASQAWNCPNNNCDDSGLSSFLWNIAVANRFGISENAVKTQDFFIDGNYKYKM